MDPKSKTFLALVVGLALLFNPFVPGVHLGDGDVYQYEAAEVEYGNETGLQVTSVQTGDSLDTLSVDDEILCTGSGLQRACRFEYHVLDGGNVSAYPHSFGYANYEFVYANDRFYRPESVERDGDWYMALEPVDDPDPLRYVAESDVPRVERELAEDGRVRTYRELPHDDQLIEVGGEYYTIYTTAGKSYSGTGSFCSSSGEGFCGAADTKRWVDTALTLGSWLAGLWLVARAWRDVRRR